MSRTRHLAASRSSACRVAQLSSRTSGMTSATDPPVERAPQGAFWPVASPVPNLPGMTVLKAHTDTTHTDTAVTDTALTNTAAGTRRRVTVQSEGVKLVGDLR